MIAMSKQRIVAALVLLVVGVWRVGVGWGDEVATKAQQSTAPAAAVKPVADPFGDSLPDFARLRLGTVRFRQGSFIAALHYLPDGKTLVSIGSDQVMRFWEAASGRELYRFGAPINYNNAGVVGAPPDANSAIDQLADSAAPGQRALSPDGQRVATLEGDQTIKLWDPATGKEVGRLGKALVSGGGRTLLTFSPDGKVLAVFENDATGAGAVQTYDIATGKELVRVTGPQPPQEGQPVVFQVTSLTLSPDAKVLATMSNEAGVTNKLRLWQTATGKAIELEESDNINPNALQAGIIAFAADNQPNFFSPDGKLLGLVVTKSEPENGNGVSSVRLWDATSGKKVRDIGNQAEMISSLHFTPDGKGVALVISNLSVKVHDLQTGKEKYALPAAADKSVARVAFAPNSRSMAVAAADGSIQLYDAANGKPTHELKTPLTNVAAVYGGSVPLTFSTDSKTVAVSSGSMIRVFDVASGKEVHPVRAGHEGDIGALAISPDGKLLATSGSDGTVRLWDPATGKQLHQVGGAAAGDATQPNALGVIIVNAGASLAFSQDSRLLAIGWTEGTIDLLDLETMKRLHQLKGHDLQPMSLVFAANGKSLASAGMDGRVLWWDATTGKMRRVIAGKPLGEEGPEVPAAFAPGQVATFPCIAMSPDCRTLAVTMPDGGGHSIGLYELATVQLRRKLRIRGEGFNIPQGFGFGGGVGGFNPFAFAGGPIAQVGAMRFMPDGKRLLWTSGSTTHLLDVAKGKEIRRFGGQDEFVNSITVSPDGKLLAAASGDGSIQLWETSTGTALGQLTGHRGSVNSVAFTPDGKELISGGADTTALVWDVPRFQEETRLAPKPILDERLGVLWKQLGHEKAEQAYEAMRQLEDTPHQAVDLVRSQLKPAAAVDAKRIARLVADLENDRFEVRMRATQLLEKLGEVSESELRKRLADNPPLEVRQRVEQLLGKLMGPVTDPDRLRAQRGVEILEHIGTPAAKIALEALAKGAPEARLTQEAKEALARLGR
jgi:WD40 repeat protein